MQTITSYKLIHLHCSVTAVTKAVGALGSIITRAHNPLKTALTQGKEDLNCKNAAFVFSVILFHPPIRVCVHLCALFTSTLSSRYATAINSTFRPPVATCTIYARKPYIRSVRIEYTLPSTVYRIAFAYEEPARRKKYFSLNVPSTLKPTWFPDGKH